MEWAFRWTQLPYKDKADALCSAPWEGANSEQPLAGKSEPGLSSVASRSDSSPLCSCCVPDHMGLSFLPTYGCQSNRTASVAALRMKAREHSEAVLQSANLLASGSPSPTPGVKPGPEIALDDKPPSAMDQNESEENV
ncbi:UNVERIFIED_CONTAM: hypothetical protein K2H54_003709 [Gekko kuhli]